MHTDLPTLGAPVMIVGLLAGFFLCFYGNVAKKYLVPLRSVLSGSAVSLAMVFFIMQKDALSSALASKGAFQALGDLLLGGEHYLFSIIAWASVAVGGLLLFALSRKPGGVVNKIVALFTGISMALFIFLLLLGFLPLGLNLALSALLLVAILVFALRDFASYIAFENSLGGALLISYLLARFWHLNFWIFLVLVVILAALGVSSQLSSLKRRKMRSEHPDGE